MMRTYPLTKDDLAQMGERMARGEGCTIPIRSDMDMTDGGTFVAGLSWGHRECYRLVKRGDAIYGAWHDEQDDFQPPTEPHIVYKAV
jgi:hypothetical protein